MYDTVSAVPTGIRVMKHADLPEAGQHVLAVVVDGGMSGDP